MEDLTVPALALLGSALPAILAWGRLGVAHGRQIEQLAAHESRLNRIEQLRGLTADSVAEQRGRLEAMARELDRVDKERRVTHDKVNRLQVSLTTAEGLLKVLEDRDSRPKSYPPGELPRG